MTSRSTAPISIRTLLAAAGALLLAACGSGSSSAPSNAARNATFTYGAAVAASPSQAAALATPLSSIASFQSAPDVDTALVFVDFSSLTGILLGDTGLGLPRLSPNLAEPDLVARSNAIRAAVVGSGFDNPACVVTTATSVTLTGCLITVDEISGGSIMHMVIHVDGSVRAVAASALTWDLRIAANVTETGAVSLTGTVSFHWAGDVAVTADKVVAGLTSELRASVSSGGQSASLGVDESLAIDVAYSDLCASKVTGGTLEAKRVWTARAGASPAELPNGAVKITWTGCGTGTVQFSR